MSVTSNTRVRTISPKSIIPDAQNAVDSSLSFTQGDLLIFDTSTHLIAAPAAESDGLTFLGVAQVTIVDGVLANPYVTATSAAEGISSIPGPDYGDEYALVSRTGEAWHMGDSAYLDPATGTRGVRSSSGTKAIGVYNGPTIASAAAGQIINILVGARFPNDTLKF